MNKELFLKQAKELLNEKAEDGSLVFKISHGLDEETKFFDGEYREDLEENIAKVIECLRLKGECAYAFEKFYALILKDRIDTEKDIREEVIRESLLKYTDVTFLLSEQIKKILDGTFDEDQRLVRYLIEAYRTGFKAEITYRGCGQCTLAALLELNKMEDDALFQATTGFSGGMSLCGDGVCGGYAGALLFFGKLRGRGFKRMLLDKDKENQYACYAASQKMHDKFVGCYGSPICREVHKKMFNGDFYILREKANRDLFEAAGAHTEKCTTVVATATMFAAEICVSEGLIKL